MCLFVLVQIGASKPRSWSKRIVEFALGSKGYLCGAPGGEFIWVVSFVEKCVPM